MVQGAPPSSQVAGAVVASAVMVVRPDVAMEEVAEAPAATASVVARVMAEELYSMQRTL